MISVPNMIWPCFGAWVRRGNEWESVRMGILMLLWLLMLSGVEILRLMSNYGIVRRVNIA